MKINSTSKTETNKDTMNTLEFQTSLLEKKYCLRYTKYQKENIRNCGKFLEDLLSFQKKALTSPTNSFDVLI